MGSEAATSPNESRSRHFDERDEGEGENAREPLAEVVEEEGVVKEVEWIAGIVTDTSVWDGDVRNPARGDNQGSRRALIVSLF